MKVIKEFLIFATLGDNLTNFLRILFYYLKNVIVSLHTLINMHKRISTLINPYSCFLSSNHILKIIRQQIILEHMKSV